uniref:Alcohol dehydrogenase iron-type/glycerol dehydrogenase GldA domain-containing protein n=1 Tax=Chromera velia CCMP2878 TaxID=1169474 RepID=A0A0G4I6Q3_9ALVE|mmetsp:Transcript_13408/g.26504  ORF Transcript_13408/g.26504 Transcript_13408/m.26504 type:complete len:426 (+) Transcript_13408:241-1518(+)|eukprot:Cvel_1915.t1-p1 / transcript=Cvel_1915.t1 / gene=Cvel_1915 / organism=Chromera_velia_CCMP2878 / gene_product=Glycerol dehydrogenase, putative / transcript_product=Glycerol dehydrogenase, putative / location=Cvel_scaffold71:144895-147068(-) / protein_length=425 / sequence_SO=supercontig / SO=protein_coding / is_pseudo=false
MGKANSKQAKGGPAPRDQPRFNPKTAYGETGCKILSSPHKYVQKAGALQYLGEYLKGLHRFWGGKGKPVAAVLAVPEMKAAYGETLQKSLESSGHAVSWFDFKGECCWDEIERVIKGLRDLPQSPLVLVSLGGGKCIDTGKAVAYTEGIPSVVVPTLASNDAPCSALSIIYTPDGVMEEIFYFPDNPYLVVVDTLVVGKAPKRFLISGIADAMATYYEAVACAENPKGQSEIGGRPTASAIALSSLCRDTLFEKAETAICASEKLAKGETVPQGEMAALDAVIEANTLLSGLGFESGGLACAHAFHNGLTSHDNTHAYLHGEKVAFSTIVHLLMLGDEEEAERVASLFVRIGLPTTLSDLGIKNEEGDEEKLREVCKKACKPGESMYNMPMEVTDEKVYDAMRGADSLGTKMKERRETEATARTA